MSDAGPVGAPGLAGSAGAADYDVDMEYARGAIGRVLLARDRRLGRTVAIKELLARGDASESRFLREARLTARLQHPSIVPVYEVGQWPGGQPFYAMKFITGRTLRQLIDETPERGRLSLLPHVIAVAEAVAYAHSNGIVHRDIKPSNVVIGAFGETMVVDWGLAKELRGGSDPAADRSPYRATHDDATSVGAVVGTPAYMPPEQAAGQPVDERADVYALGALLYHVLAGEPPYRGSDSAEVLRSVLAGPGPRLERRARRAPADLVAIVDKAMARDADERYRNAGQLADDLRRFQTGQLVAARPYGGAELVLRWVARHRVVVACALVLAIGSVVAVTRILRESARAEARSNEMVVAQARAWLERDPTTAAAWLKHYPTEGRDWAAVRDVGLQASALGVARHVFHRANTNSYGAFSPNGTRYAVEGAANEMTVRDVATGAVAARLAHDGLPLYTLFARNDRVVFVDTRRLALHIWDLAANRDRAVLDGEGQVGYLDTTPDGRWAATANSDGTVRLFDLDAGSGRVLGRHGAVASYVRLSRDGRFAASVAEDASLIVWDLRDGTHREVARGLDLCRLDFTSDASYLVGGASNGLIHLWSLDGREHRTLAGHQGNVRDVRFSHDDSLLASAGDDKTVRLWDWRRGTATVWAEHSDAVYRVAFSPDDDVIASASRDETVRLWSRRTGALRTLRGHSSTVFDVEFSSDGTLLASNALDRSVRVWPVPDDLLRAHPISSDAIADVAFVDESRVLTAGADGRVKLSHVLDGNAVTVAEHGSGIRRVVVSDDGGRWAALEYSGGVSYADRKSGVVRRFDMAPVPGWAAALSCHGESLAVAAGDGTVRVWRFADGTQTVLRQHRQDVYSVAYSSDCRWLASAGVDGDIVLADAATGIEARRWHGDGARIALLAFSSDSRHLGAVDWRGRLHLVDLRDGRARLVGDGESDRLTTIALQPNGDLAAAAGDDGAIRLWRTDGTLVHTLRGHSAAVQHVVFSPDGSMLASCSDDHTVRLWDSRTGAELRVLPHQGQLRRVAFSPRGDLLAAAARDARLHVWRVRSALGGDARPDAVRAWVRRLTTAETTTGTLTTTR